MTVRISGVLTLFQNVVKPGFICVWCGANQIDIVLQGRYSKFDDDALYKQLDRMISYLWFQNNPIAVMRLKAPKVADTRW